MTMPEQKKAVVPRLRFPEFRDAGPWEVKRLGEVGTIIKGKGISKSDIKPNGIWPCIRYGELYTHYREVIRTIVSFTDADPGDLVLSQQNDLIIPASGETKEDIATASCVMLDGVALGGDLNIFRSPIDGRFLAYYVRGNLKTQIAKVAQGDSVVHLYPSQLEKVELGVPHEPAEQQKIADCLSSLDELIELQAKQLEALQAHKKGLMQQLFPREGETTPRLRFPEFRNAGPWEVKRLSDIARHETSSLTLNTLVLTDSGYPIYGANGCIGFIDSFEQEDKYIAMVKDGSGVGRLTIREGKSSVLSTLTYIKPREKSVLVTWLYYCLSALDLSCFIKGSGIPHIYFSDVGATKVGLPSLPEQQKIADCLSSLDELIELQAKQLEALQAHKKGLMQQLFPQEIDL